MSNVSVSYLFTYLCYSMLLLLFRYLVNSFHIKVEDEYYSGRDEIKAFILSTFAKLKSSSTRCILCKHELTVFNRSVCVANQILQS